MFVKKWHPSVETGVLTPLSCSHLMLLTSRGHLADRNDLNPIGVENMTHYRKA